MRGSVSAGRLSRCKGKIKTDFSNIDAATAMVQDEDITRRVTDNAQNVATQKLTYDPLAGVL